MTKSNRWSVRRNALDIHSQQGLPKPTINSLTNEVHRLRLLVDELRDEFQHVLEFGRFGDVALRVFSQPKISTAFEEEAARRDREQEPKRDDEAAERGHVLRQGSLFP